MSGNTYDTYIYVQTLTNLCLESIETLDIYTKTMSTYMTNFNEGSRVTYNT